MGFLYLLWVHNNVRSLRRNLENLQVHLLDELTVAPKCHAKIVIFFSF